MVARLFSNIAVATTLLSGITDSATSLTVASSVGYPSAPFTIAIEPDTGDEEVVLVGVKTGDVF